MDEWRAEWQEAQALVPDAADLSSPPEQETCQDVLGELRKARPELSPAPDHLVETTVEAWFEHAEGMFFDCFDGASPDAEVRRAYEGLERLTGEVAAALGN